MSTSAFTPPPNLKERLTAPETTQARATTHTAAPDAAPMAAAMEAPASRSGGGESFWAKLFDFLFGWLKSDRATVTEVNTQDPVETEPDPLQEARTPPPDPEEEVETPENTQKAEDLDPVTQDPVETEPEPEPEPETGTPFPDPEPEPEEVEQEEAPEATEDAENSGPVPQDPDPVVDDEPVTEGADPAGPVTRQIAPTDLDSGAAISVAGGRVTTLTLPDAAGITGVTIDTLPAHGNVTVNPDFTLALVLSGSDYNGPLSFDYTVTRSDGTVDSQTATLDVMEPTQAAGWGLGNHYMLETDADDRLVVEHGDNHRKVYISGSEDALTRADIAALEDVSESVITKTWLRNNPEYGGSEGMALASDVGMELWYDLTASWEEPSSNWLLFERGYDYTDIGQIVTRGLTSESELHPVYITAWGEGPRPVLDTKIQVWQRQSDNIVLSDLEVKGGLSVLSTGDNILISHMDFAESGLNIQRSSGFTLRYSEISHNTGTAPEDGGTWGAIVQGFFSVDTHGILLEGNIFHHNGWESDYLIDGSYQGGMAPNMYSQNVYLQYNTTDVTYRDNITSQAASQGAQLRGGGFVEGNLFLDNNVAFNVLGGNYKDFGFVGNYSLVLDNVTTSGGYKIAPRDGASAWGNINQGQETAFLNNIVAHLANPDDPDEQAWKVLAQIAQTSQAGGTAFYDDTIVLNWQGSERSGSRADDSNLEGVDIDTAMTTTIQRYAAEFLDVPLSQIADGTQLSGYYQSTLITELMNHLLAARDVDGGQMFTAREIIDYFQEGFNITATPTGDTHHRFIPNDLGDGVRWDNRLNWTSDARPEDGDTVDLGGNWVNFSDTVRVASLDLGTGGKLQVGSGKLTVDTLETGANGMIFVERAGQVWVDGYDGSALLSLQVTGGRFANTGDVSGPVIASVTGGQMILAADDAQFGLADNSELRIEGTGAKVGFDGATGGVATLKMQDGGQLSFVASADGLGRITEFRSGAWDQEGSDVQSGVALDGTLTLDLSGYIGTGQMKLVDVDAIVGMFDDIQIHGLGDNRDADVVIDYAADLITLELSAGTGQGRLEIRGDATYGDDEDADLWDELTAGLELGDDPDATVTVLDDPIDALPEMNFI